MCVEDSVRDLVAQVKLGDEAAIQRLWDRFFPQVVRFAGHRLSDQPRQMADEEDVAISVLESFFRAANAGRFPQLEDRDGVWRLLSMMTRRKVVDFVRRNAARPVVGESALENSNAANPWEQQAADDPTPMMIAMVSDEIQRLLQILPEKYHTVALKKLECQTLSEIAEACGVHVSTVERRLRIIRAIWEKELQRA